MNNMSKIITILGIESSCDDTAAAVVRLCESAKPVIMASKIFGQETLHEQFGGVVPEIAARAHAEKLDYIVEDALKTANLGLKDLDAIAVTAGPGLIGGVISGVMCAKGLAAGANKPLIGINHLAGHALTPRLTDSVEFPYLMLLISGGHCQFLIVKSAVNFQRLGATIDDAPGEAFDKVARLLSLPQPGGPNIQISAQTGNSKAYKFPRPLLDIDGCNMSFSGLKTAVLRTRNKLVDEQGGLFKKDQSDISASFQEAISDVLYEKTRRALAIYLEAEPNNPVISVSGGVASNILIRQRLNNLAKENAVQFIAPPINLCTDNAAMIAWAGLEHFRLGITDDMYLKARPRWPLDQSAPPFIGHGKKGPKS
jgi:N6-L-threonylcarbamoyladenine synthase